MNKIIKYTFLLGLISLVSSCDMDITTSTAIEVAPGTPLIQNRDNLEKFRNGFMAAYRASQYGIHSYTTEVQCDMFNAAVDFGNRNGAPHRMDNGFNPSDYSLRDVWVHNYSALKDINVFLSQIDNFQGTAEDVAYGQVCKGYALFFRAAQYHQLIRHYAKDYEPTTAKTDLGVPLLLEHNIEARPSRATVEAVYNQIITDLENAEKLLVKEEGEPRSGFPTIDVVKALKARVLLAMHNYKEAATTAKSIIDKNKYILASNNEEMVAEYINDNGNESILQLAATLTEEGSGRNDIFTNYATKKINNKNIVVYQPDFVPTKTLIGLYNTNDIRLANWFDTKKYGVYLVNSIRPGVFVFTKYPGNPKFTSNGVPNSRQKVKPFLIGEQYLIAAEAYFLDGNVAQAKVMLNALQQKRGATLTEATMANIQKEWAKETVGEGLRMDCLKRWKLGFNGRVPQDICNDNNLVNKGDNYEKKSVNADTYFFNWAIPTNELQTNENIKTQQNPGW